MSRQGFRTDAAMRPGSFSFPVVIDALNVVDPEAGDKISRQTKLTATLLSFLIMMDGGVALGSAGATIAACIAILLFGLPHGSLDLEIVRREHRVGHARMSSILLLYVGLAAAMAAVWQFAPVFALATFLLVAVVHFAEDWAESRSTFLAQGMAIALLTAPTFLHLGEIENLFAVLSGRPEAAILASVMLMLAPMSLAVAAVAVACLQRRGSTDQAAAGAMMLIGMIVLPPVIGFALFFCLYHSPRHLGTALSRVGRTSRSRWIVPLVTLAGIGLAVILFAGQLRPDISAQFVAASFMTLSLLTVPHMIVPVIVERLAWRPIGASASVNPDRAFH